MRELEHLQLTEGGKQRMQEVEDFLHDLANQAHPLADKARAEFEKRIAYLENYGGAVSEGDPRRRFRVVLGRDWSPMSFTISWYRLDMKTGEYVASFRGGLIWHGGANDPLCVTLTPCLWGVHT